MLKSLFYKFFKNEIVPDKEGFQHIDRNKFKAYNQYRPDGAKKHFCYVPFNSLTFSFKGKVYSCTYNRDIVLGNYPENTIDEIWNGEEANKLREYMRNNDLSYGCQHCKYFFDKEKFSNLKPLVFDKYSDIDQVNFPRVLEFEMSNVCNFECQMCSGEVSSMIRKNRDHLPPIDVPYDKEFVKQLEKYIPHVKEAKFFGGEPFLIDIYHDIWDKMLEINPKIEFFLITNGSVWNNRVRNLLEKGHFEIAISIDSLQKEKLERIRKHAKFETLIANIHNFNKYAQKHGRAISLSFTLQKENWDEFPDMIKFCNEIGAFIFVSYLEWPENFSVADLSIDELVEIRKYMDQFEFSGLTGYKKHNAKCYSDFKGYLDNFIEKKNVGRYLEYRLENTQSKQLKNKLDLQMSKPYEELLQELEVRMNKYFTEKNIETKFSQDFKTKLDQLLQPFNSEAKKYLVLMMNMSNQKVLLDDMNNMPLEDLIKRSQQMIENFEK
ncbi:MAG TPA: twitch domain-containing radical SAM protein [Chitinophagales bacterium]|nr:twitch domain-containing radical SAM protein [Chitinophagales bacterium]